MTVLSASPTDEPIIGMIFAAVNFKVLDDKLSLEAARVPFNEMKLRSKEKTKVKRDKRDFLRDFVTPISLS